MITGNKGEWSELYVLFKLLGEQKIYAGDGNLNRLDAFYPILKILRSELKNELTRNMEYSFRQNIVIITENGDEISQISVAEFLEHSKTLFKDIQVGGNGNGAFGIASQNDFLNKIHCEKIKAKTRDKADIHIVIHDYHTGMKPKLGFSIKSDVGANPTLLNASSSTTFVYKIDGEKIKDSDVIAINTTRGSRKMQDRVNAINELGCILKYQKMENSTFLNNLRMIDSALPEILGWMMADCYKNRDMTIRNAVERITKANPLNFNLSDGHDFYGYKIKSFMVASALGMVPATKWNGRYDATGGYIVVKSDGDVVCFHIYDRNLLEDYLFNNTKFETPSGNRYNHLGEVYSEADSNFYFNLNLQVRFK